MTNKGETQLWLDLKNHYWTLGLRHGALLRAVRAEYERITGSSQDCHESNR